MQLIVALHKLSHARPSFARLSGEDDYHYGGECGSARKHDSLQWDVTEVLRAGRGLINRQQAKVSRRYANALAHQALKGTWWLRLAARRHPNEVRRY
jgi:hypothetical protein